MALMRRAIPWLLLAFSMLLVGALALGQGGGVIIFVNRRPPRELTGGGIRGWANANQVRTYQEDEQSHVWRLQFMVFAPRAPGVSEVTMVFYHVERTGGVRRYVHNEGVMLADPSERMFYASTVIHREEGVFEPMENYEVQLTRRDERGSHAIASGRIGLLGRVEHHEGTVDFTGQAPVVR